MHIAKVKHITQIKFDSGTQKVNFSFMEAYDKYDNEYAKYSFIIIVLLCQKETTIFDRKLSFFCTLTYSLFSLHSSLKIAVSRE